MHLKRWIISGSAVLLTSCVIYDQDLIDGAQGDSVTGDGDGDSSTDTDGSGGKSSSGDGDTDGSGGRGSGGEGETDTGDFTGDGDSGGATGDGDGDSGTGGTAEATGGADASGGADGSSGGSTPTGPDCSAAKPCLVDDMEHPNSASYYKLPFNGNWGRYGEDDPTDWGAATEKEMFIVDPNDTGGKNHVLHVEAAGLDDWGIGIYVTTKVSPNVYVDVSKFSGIRFKIMSLNTESVVQVALADNVSHDPICKDPVKGSDEVDCNKHMRSGMAPTIDIAQNTWTAFELPFATFTDVGLGDPREETTVNLNEIYAIHFQFDPDGEVADFYLDDLEIY